MSDTTQLGERLAQLRDEFQKQGFEATMFWRSPGQAKAPVAYLLIGETFDDVQEARKNLNP